MSTTEQMIEDIEQMAQTLKTAYTTFQVTSKAQTRLLRGIVNNNELNVLAQSTNTDAQQVLTEAEALLDKRTSEYRTMVGAYEEVTGLIGNVRGSIRAWQHGEESQFEPTHEQWVHLTGQRIVQQGGQGVILLTSLQRRTTALESDGSVDQLQTRSTALTSEDRDHTLDEQ